MKESTSFSTLYATMIEKIIYALILTLSIYYYILILQIYSQFKNYLFGIDAEEATLKPCRVPNLNPFDVTILKYIEKPDKLICSSNGPLVNSNLNYLYVNKHLLPVYGVENITSFQCCYREFERDSPKETEADNGIIFGSKCKPFISKTKINYEFIEVVCTYQEIEIYNDIFSFVPIKINTNRNNNENIKQKLNVLMIGIDSLSHMNFQRQMPKTKKYIDTKLNSVLISGYNKVDDNTLPNLVPILTGKSLGELNKTCLKSGNRKFDECHFIWNDYSNAGYLTAFAEDNSIEGLFHYQMLGFQEQPTHYYWRTFNYFAEQELRDGFCLGSKPIHQVVLDYTKKVVHKLKNKPFFGLFLSGILSHDCLNCPSLSDEDYVEFFDSLNRRNVLNKTVVAFFSDHGIRYGDILETYQGYLEERLPLLYFIFPPWFDKSYSNAIKNMRENKNRLSANFDIYETLMDLLDVDKLETKYSTQNKDDSMEMRGISLFSIVPENRTCKMAGIPAHWCTCKSRYIVSTHSSAVKKIANFIVAYINKLLENYDKCAQLELKSIKTALSTKFLSSNQNVLKEYTITLTTMPGGALFAGTVSCSVDCYNEDSYVMSGSVSRLNKYGNQSNCISHFKLRMYCYCI